MASALTNTAYDALMKDYYTQNKLFNLTYTDRPFLAMLQKDPNYGGRKYIIPTVYADMQARSSTFSVAKSLSTTSTLKAVDFELTAIRDYAIGTVDSFTIATTKQDKHAHVSALQTKIESTINTLSNSCAFALCRDSSGYIGQVLAEPALAGDTVIAMKFGSDITPIEAGQTINIHSAKTGGTLRTVDGSVSDLLVKSVDRAAGTFTIEDPYTVSGTITGDDFVFPKGDRNLRVSGLESWLPFEAPLPGQLFMDVDRSVDSTRLAGVRYDGTNDNIEQALLTGLSKCGREGGGSPGVFLMNFDNLNDLIQLLGSKVQYININVPHVQAGFFGVQIIGPNGPVKCIADRYMTHNYAYALSMDTWKLCSTGDLIQVTDEDGNKALRQSDDDGIEFRYRSFYNLACLAPGHNAVVKLK